MTTIVTRLYDYHADAHRVVTDLRQAGLTGHDISLVVGPEPGMDTIDPAGDPSEVESDASVGLGSVFGGRTADGPAEAVRRGRTIVTVHLPEGREAEMMRILDRYPSIDPAQRDDS